MSMIVSSSRPSRSRHTRMASSIEATINATWWTLPTPRMAGGTRSAGDGIGQLLRFVSDRDQLAVDTERDPQPVADLADRRIRIDGFDDRREQVVRPTRGIG